MNKVRRIPIEDFLKTEEQTIFKISPSGEKIACLKSYKTRLNVFIKNFETENDVRITECEDRSIIDYMWANDNRIIYMKDTDGDEDFRFYAVDINGENFKELTPFEGVRSQFINSLKDDNENVLITMNKRNKHMMDVYKLNVYSGELEMIAENPGGVMEWNVDHNGDVRVGLELDGVATKILYRENGNDEFKVILDCDYKEYITVLGFTEDNKNLIISSNIERDKFAIFEFDPRAMKHSKLIYENDLVDVERVFISEKTKKVLASLYIDEKIRYNINDENFKIIYDKITSKLPNQDILLDGMNRDEDKIMIYVYSDRNPGTYYLYDVNKDELTKIADEKPWINPEEMAEVKPIKYLSRDGLIINGYLTIPKGAEPKNLPIVVVPHGGPWARDIWIFSPDNQFLANRGYGVLQMNFRGSTGYGRQFKEKGFKQWGKAMQDDITDGVNYLIEEGIAAKDRVAIYGISYGGYATLAGLAFTPNLYNCGIDVVGPSNLFTSLEGIPDYMEPVRKMMYEMNGDPEKDKDLLREASPLFHADKIRKPLFVVQGARDPRVPQHESDQIVGALRGLGREVKYMLKENEGHGFRNQENIIEMYNEIEKFLEDHMGR